MPRFLGDDDFGTLSFAGVFVGFFALIAGLGTRPVDHADDRPGPLGRRSLRLQRARHQAGARRGPLVSLGAIAARRPARARPADARADRHRLRRDVVHHRQRGAARRAGRHRADGSAGVWASCRSTSAASSAGPARRRGRGRCLRRTSRSRSPASSRSSRTGAGAAAVRPRATAPRSGGLASRSSTAGSRSSALAAFNLDLRQRRHPDPAVFGGEPPSAGTPSPTSWVGIPVFISTAVVAAFFPRFSALAPSADRPVRRAGQQGASRSSCSSSAARRLRPRSCRRGPHQVPLRRRVRQLGVRDADPGHPDPARRRWTRSWHGARSPPIGSAPVHRRVAASAAVLNPIACIVAINAVTDGVSTTGRSARRIVTVGHRAVHHGRRAGPAAARRAGPRRPIGRCSARHARGRGRWFRRALARRRPAVRRQIAVGIVVYAAASHRVRDVAIETWSRQAAQRTRDGDDRRAARRRPTKSMRADPSK